MHRKHHWLWGVVCSINLIFGAQVLAETTTSLTSSTAANYLGINAQVENPAVRAAAEQILEKQAKLQDYQGVIDTTTTFPRLGKNITHAVEIFRQQPISFKYDKKGVSTGVTKAKHSSGIVMDGKTLWIQEPATSQHWYQPALNKTRKIDWTRVQKAHPEESNQQLEDVFNYNSRLRKPFSGLNAYRVKILREDEDVWVFSDNEMEVMVGKADGLLRSSSSNSNPGTDANISHVILVSELKINTGLTSSSAFVFTPRRAEMIKDLTVETLAEMKKNKEKRK